MRLADLPQVVDIERQSFPSMWPQTVYQKELKNKLARYLVAYEPADEGEPDVAASDEPPSGIRGLMQRVFRDAPAGPRDRILGMVGLWCVIGEGHIVTIAVREELRRLGIGEILLVAIIEAAVEAGQEEITLEYRVSNEAARAMYEKFGFSQLGLRAGYYSDNQEDAVLMTTPPLRSTRFRKLMAERVAEQRARWGDRYPFGDRLRMLGGVKVSR